MTIFELVLDFYHHPSRHESLLDPAECLPEGIDMLLGMSVNDSLREASIFAQTPEEFHNAVAFFIENVMFAEGADYYRQLGLKPGSSLPQIRRNYELLSRFYYPGKEGGMHSLGEVYAMRINRAYNALWNFSLLISDQIRRLIR